MYKGEPKISEPARLFTAEAIFEGFKHSGYNHAGVSDSRDLSEGVIKPEFSIRCIWNCGKKLWNCKEECATDFDATECIACLGDSWDTCKACF